MKAKGETALDSDQTLVDRAAKGDSNAFGQLYERTKDWVYALAYRFTQDHNLALDVVQETYTYLVTKIPTLTLTAKLTTFLYPVVRNNALNLLKRQKRFAGSADDLDELPAPASIGDQDLTDLGAALKNLPQAQRQVLLMRYVDGMTNQEIATALDLPLGTVKSRLHHALEFLRQDPGCRRYFLDQPS